MKIGIATCSEKPDLTPGDRLFVDALKRLGVEAKTLIWTDPESLNETLDGIVIRSTWDYHKNSQKFREWIKKAAACSGKLFNSSEIINWNLDKSYLLDLSERGVATVPSLLLKKEDDIAKILGQIQQKAWREIVIKPTISATAYLTFKADAFSADLPQQLAKIQTHSDIIVQPYLSAIEEVGEVSLIFLNGQERELSHALLKEPKKGDFRVQADFGGRESSFTQPKELINFANAALDKVRGDWAFARVDIIDWKKAPVIGEIEMIEPDLFLQMDAAAPERLARTIVHKIS